MAVSTSMISPCPWSSSTTWSLSYVPTWAPVPAMSWAMATWVSWWPPILGISLGGLVGLYSTGRL